MGKMGINWRVKRKNLIDVIIYGLILCISMAFVLSLPLRGKNPFVIILFILTGVYCYIEIVRSQVAVTVYRIFFIFSYIFFFMAPIQQYAFGTILWRNTGLSLNYNDENYIITSFVILMGIVLIAIGYRSAVSKQKKDTPNSEGVKNKKLQSRNLGAGTSILITLVSTGAFILLLVTRNISSTNLLLGSSALGHQLLNILRYIPVCALLIFLMYKEDHDLKQKKLLFTIVIVEVAIIYFPFWGSMSRFILFGAYISLYAFVFRKTDHPSVFFLIVFLGFCFSFSSSRHMTSITDLLPSPEINFRSVDFDAFQMTMASIQYVKEHGVLFGRNILSALAFFIPRSIWTGKLEGTGTLIVRYFGSWQENVSEPLFAEFYMAAGVFGILIFSLLVGMIVKKVDAMANSHNYMLQGIYSIVAGMTMYILRGALLASLSYTAGLLIAMYLMYIISSTRVGGGVKLSEVILEKSFLNSENISFSTIIRGDCGEVRCLA